VLVVAGSRGMAGAAVLAGSAALRGGAGLVTVACPAEVQDVVAVGNPCYTTAALPTEPLVLVAMAARIDVLAVGPGLGRSQAVAEKIGFLLEHSDRPAVVDADALNVQAVEAVPKRAGPTVLTPHPGEFSKLTGKSIADIQANREALAVEFARSHKCVVLLKGAQTVVADGDRVYVNDTGNPGMATGGCGDVLTGLIGAFLGQRLIAFDAAVLGAWVHGRAGDHAAGVLGQTAVTASDLLTYLPHALREVGG
jgi:ADP-dependent NAD(P)H-hydrate dehydratase